jgi:hypothetical protein
LQKNSNPGAGRPAPGFFFVFRGFFEGGFGKSDEKLIVFCGGVVVICW